MSILKQYENETGKKATRKKGYEYQYTFKYVAWLENNIQSDKALLKRCLTTLRNIRNTVTVTSTVIYVEILDQLISDLEKVE